MKASTFTATNIEDGNDIRHSSWLEDMLYCVSPTYACLHAVSGLEVQLFVCFGQTRMLFAGHSEKPKPMEMVIKGCKPGESGSRDDDVCQTLSNRGAVAGLVEDLLRIYFDGSMALISDR